jgi:SLT domain-containing protein
MDASSVVLVSHWEGGTKKRKWYYPTGQKRSPWVMVHGRKKRLIGVVLKAEKRGQNMDHFLASEGMMMMKVVENPKIVPNQTEQVELVEEVKPTLIDAHS